MPPKNINLTAKELKDLVKLYGVPVNKVLQILKRSKNKTKRRKQLKRNKFKSLIEKTEKSSSQGLGKLAQENDLSNELVREKIKVIKDTKDEMQKDSKPDNKFSKEQEDILKELADYKLRLLSEPHDTLANIGKKNKSSDTSSVQNIIVPAGRSGNKGPGNYPVSPGVMHTLTRSEAGRLSEARKAPTDTSSEYSSLISSSNSRSSAEQVNPLSFEFSEAETKESEKQRLNKPEEKRPHWKY